MSSKVSSEHLSKPPPQVPSGSDGKKTPPPSSLHRRDSISLSSVSSQGIIGRVFSPLTCFVSIVMDGFAYCCSFIRWPFETLGILTPRTYGALNKPPKSLEEQKQDLLDEFSKGSHSHRLDLLVYKIASWPGDTPEELFIELFNQQDKEVIEFLTHEVFNGFDWGEDVEIERPAYLYQALHAQERSSEQEICVDHFRTFLFEFPDYALHYAASCFEPDAPDYLHYRGLELLASHKGKTQSFHVEKIDDQDVDVVIQNAFNTYFRSLSPKEQWKLVGLVSEDCFKSVDMDLISNLVSMKDIEEQVVKIFQSVTDFEKTSNFEAFMNTLYLVNHSSSEWRGVKEALLAALPEVREWYVEAKVNMFFQLDSEVKAEACMNAYETDPTIFHGRLVVLTHSKSEYGRARANRKMLVGNEPAAVQLFYLFQERFIRKQVSLYQKDKVEVETTFKENWEDCFNFESGIIIHPKTFIEKMVEVQTDSAYLGAAEKLLTTAFGS